MKKMELFRKLFPRRISISFETVPDISQRESHLKGKILQIRDISDPDRHVIINFDLSGKLKSIELGTNLLNTQIKILERSFDGKFYIYFGNCKNLTSSHKGVYSYYDYYNQEISEDLKKAKILVRSIFSLLKEISEIDYKTTNKIIFVKKKIKDGEITIAKTIIKVPSSLIKIIKDTYKKYKWEDLLKERILLQKIYSTPISVLPPEVRPDQNPVFAIIQMTQGCWIQSTRGPCRFCNSYRGISYKEKNIDDLKKHMEQVKKFTGKGWKYVRKFFLSDADPLNTKINSEIYLKFIAKKAPKAVWYESFVSTPTILSKSEKQWKKLMALGLRKLYWGVESADDMTLKFLGKIHNKKMLYKAALRLNKIGINYVVIIMSGISFLTSKNQSGKSILNNSHLRETSKFIHDINCPIVYISRFTPQPGTEIFNLIKKNKLNLSLEKREIEHRIMVKMISYNKENFLIPNREVRGTYGIQFFNP